MNARLPPLWIGFACVSAAFTLWWLIRDALTLSDVGNVWRYDHGRGLVFGIDFFNFWSYGTEAWGPDPGRYFNFREYWAFVADYAGAPAWTPFWSYPPTLMLLAAPFGLLPYGAAYLLWLALTGALFLLVLRPWLASPWHVLLALMTPAALLQFHSGQNAFFFASLLIAGFRFAGPMPALAGLCFGLLTMKPQLGVLVIFLLILSDYRRAFWWGTAAALLFNGLSIAIFGTAPWSAYLDMGLNAQLSVLRNNDPTAHLFMPSLYISLQLLGAQSVHALLAQGLLALALFKGAFDLWRANGDIEIRLGYALGASVAATPYLMGYDLLCALPLVFIALKRFELRLRDHLILMAFISTPLITYALGGSGLPGGVLPMLLGLYWFQRRAMNRPLWPFATRRQVAPFMRP